MSDLLKQANSTKDPSLLINLAKNPSMLVRKAVARNHFTPKRTLDNLAYDAVKNVSYSAIKNPNYKGDRVIDKEFLKDASKCVVCLKSELHLDCPTCKTERYPRMEAFYGKQQ